MHAIQTLTGFHAFTLWELRLVWKDMYPDAASFDQVVSSLGWDAEEANDLADKHEWLMERKAMWPEGLTNRQLTAIIDGAVPPTLFDPPDAEPTADVQTLLNIAAEKSYSDLKKAMIEKGLKKAQPYYYLVIDVALLVFPYVPRPENPGFLVLVVQTRDEEGMKRAIRDRQLCAEIEHPVVLRIGKAVLGVEAKRNRFALSGGQELNVIQWPTENEEET
jgi:hypothetical protein